MCHIVHIHGADAVSLGDQNHICVSFISFVFSTASQQSRGNQLICEVKENKCFSTSPTSSKDVQANWKGYYFFMAVFDRK